MKTEYFIKNFSTVFNHKDFTLFSFLSKVVDELIFAFYSSELQKSNAVFRNIYQYVLENNLANVSEFEVEGEDNLITEISVNQNTRSYLSKMLADFEKNSDFEFSLWIKNFERDPESSLNVLLDRNNNLSRRQVKLLLLRISEEVKNMDPLLKERISDVIADLTVQLVKTRSDSGEVRYIGTFTD